MSSRPACRHLARVAELEARRVGVDGERDLRGVGEELPRALHRRRDHLLHHPRGHARPALRAPAEDGVDVDVHDVEGELPARLADGIHKVAEAEPHAVRQLLRRRGRRVEVVRTRPHRRHEQRGAVAGVRVVAAVHALGERVRRVEGHARKRGVAGAVGRDERATPDLGGSVDDRQQPVQTVLPRAVALAGVGTVPPTARRAVPPRRRLQGRQSVRIVANHAAAVRPDLPATLLRTRAQTPAARDFRFAPAIGRRHENF